MRYFFFLRLRPVGVVGASGRPSGRRRRPPTGGRSLKIRPRAGVPHPAAVVGGHYEFEGGVIFFFASLSFDLFFPLHSDLLISKMADVDVDAFSVT